MKYDFDRIIDRGSTGSIKWSTYPPDVLPLWVADMDFPAAQEITDALVNRSRHGFFGYTCPPEELLEVLVSRMQTLYGWKIEPDWIVFMGGVIAGFNVACHAVSEPGKGLLLFPPIYPPMLDAAGNSGMVMQAVPLLQNTSGVYRLDWAAIQKAVTPDSRAVLICSPHNPVGKVFTRDELHQLAEFCQAHNLWIISDEIHCDLIFRESQHIPVASLSPEVSKRTITLMAPSKTFNIPGLGFSFAIVENPVLRRQLVHADQGMMPHVNLMGFTAALAAYSQGGDWLEQVLNYLQENYQFLLRFVESHLPGITLTPMQGTYLAWLDCRKENLQPDPYHFFLENARVALNNGHSFGPGGDGFVRLNFACPRSVLQEALERMKAALDRRV